MFANSKKVTTFAPAIEREILDKKDGPFVYRLGRKIFILERGVRFPHGLPNKKAIDKSMAFLFLSCFVQGIQYSRVSGFSWLVSLGQRNNLRDFIFKHII